MVAAGADQHQPWAFARCRCQALQLLRMLLLLRMVLPELALPPWLLLLLLRMAQALVLLRRQRIALVLLPLLVPLLQRMAPILALLGVCVLLLLPLMPGPQAASSPAPAAAEA